WNSNTPKSAVHAISFCLKFMITPSNRLASATPLEVTSPATIAVVNKWLMTNGVICRDFKRVWPDDITSSLHTMGAIKGAIMYWISGGKYETARSELPHSQHDRSTNVLRQRLAEAFFAVPLQKYHSRPFSSREPESRSSLSRPRLDRLNRLHNALIEEARLVE